MRSKKRDFKDEQGTALIATLMFLMAMSILSTALVFTVQNEMKASTAYKFGQQAFYVASAGVQCGVDWFKNNYSPHVPASDYDATALPVHYSGNSVLLAGQTGSTSVYPESEVSSSFSDHFGNTALQANNKNSGVYALNATLLKYTPATFLDTGTFLTTASAMERWRLNSIGYWGSVAKPLGIAQITAEVENSGNAFFDRALWGINSVSLSGNVNIDSYNPSLGPYGGSNVGNLGSVGTNGSATLSGSVTIRGDLAYGPTGSYHHSGTASVTGDILQQSSARVFPPIPAITVGSQNVSLSGHNTLDLSPGSYNNLSLSGQSICNLGPGVYYFNSISTSGQAYIGITGVTTIFVKSSLSLSGGSMVNSTQDPGNLSVFFSGNGNVSMSGNSAFYGVVYAPQAPLSLSGTSGFFGSFIAASVSNSGTSDIHFDEGSMNEYLVQQPFRLMTWSQDVY
jgi:hypothetical protein